MNKPFSIKALHQKVEQAINALSLTKKPQELYGPIRYSLAMGGKRIRPIMLLASCNLFDENIDVAVNAAVGIEIFHNFTLLHDDIMDNAPLRRGNPTVHSKWNNNIAMLSGDTMFVKASELMTQCDDNKLREVLEVYHKTAIEVCEGQQLDMNFETTDNVSIPQYIQMITLKTAVLVAASLKIGAILGGALPEDAENMYLFGKNLGIAFQLQDDILDVYGSPDKFGKQIGGDIILNKKTYLLLKAFQIADRYKKEELANWIFAPQFDAIEKVQAVTEIYNYLNIRELAKKEFEKYYALAFSHFDKVPVNEERKIEILSISRSLLGREE